MTWYLTRHFYGLLVAFILGSLLLANLFINASDGQPRDNEACFTDSCIYDRLRSKFDAMPSAAKRYLCQQKKHDYVQFHDSKECESFRESQKRNPQSVFYKGKEACWASQYAKRHPKACQ